MSSNLCPVWGFSLFFNMVFNSLTLYLSKLTIFANFQKNSVWLNQAGSCHELHWQAAPPCGWECGTKDGCLLFLIACGFSVLSYRFGYLCAITPMTLSLFQIEMKFRTMTCLNFRWFFRYIVSVWIFVHDYTNDALVFLFIYKEMKKTISHYKLFFRISE